MSRRFKKNFRPKRDVAPSETASPLTSRPENQTAAHNLRWMIPGICLLIATATWVVFGQTVRYEFVNFDDDIYVYENPRITGGLTLQGIGWAFTHIHYENWWAKKYAPSKTHGGPPNKSTNCLNQEYFRDPLTTISHMLDCQLYGLKAGGHHFTNVLLHTIAAILLFLALQRMTGALWRSAFVATVFAIHPLHVESVAWVAERKDVLSGVFFMLTLLAYVHYVRAPSIRRYLVVAFVFALGLMSKPMLVTLPFVLLLLDYWPLGRFVDLPYSHGAVSPSRGQRGERLDTARRQQLQAVVNGRLLKPIVEKIPLIALCAVSSIVTFLARRDAIGWTEQLPIQRDAIGWTEQLPILARINNALVTYVLYISQMFWPVKLAVFYPHPKNRLLPSEIVVALAILIAVTAATFVLRKKRPYLMTGWLWYLGMLVPVIGLVQEGWQGRADRYTYLPQIGLLLLIAWAIGNLCSSLRHRSAVLGAGALMAVAALMVCAHLQASRWKNSESLWRHTLACTSGNNIAHNNLGTALLQTGRRDEAAIHFQKALEVQPKYPAARNNLGNVFFQKGQVDEAVAHYQKALEINPNFALARYNLGVAFLQNGRVPEAVRHFQGALEIEPDFANAHYNLGIAFVQLGRVSEAILHYNKALEIDPNYAEAEYNLGIALLQVGRLNEAISHYNKALVINPNYVEAHNNLGTALLQLGRVSEALKHFQKAIEMNPLNVEAQNNMALVLATFPETRVRNGTKAVELAEHADHLTGNRNASISATLAAAYAEAGQFPNAIKTAERALQLATDQGNPALADAIRAQIRLYQSGFPYRYNSQRSMSASGTQQ
jgi:protein O-mannosyl-transferase